MPQPLVRTTRDASSAHGWSGVAGPMGRPVEVRHSPTPAAKLLRQSPPANAWLKRRYVRVRGSVGKGTKDPCRFCSLRGLIWCGQLCGTTPLSFVTPPDLRCLGWWKAVGGGWWRGNRRRGGVDHPFRTHATQSLPEVSQAHNGGVGGTTAECRSAKITCRSSQSVPAPE
jgi:hypothetical protein